MLFLLPKMTLKSIRSVETAIITGMGFDTPPHRKSLEKNLQNITRNISEHPKSIDDTYAFSKAIQMKVQSQWAR